QASPVTSALCRAPERGCSRTGPATADAESRMKVADTTGTCHISLARVAANGAASAPQRGCRVGDPAPPGAEASPVTSAFRRAPEWGCSRTGPATADAESSMKVEIAVFQTASDTVRLKPDTTEISLPRVKPDTTVIGRHHDTSMK